VETTSASQPSHGGSQKPDLLQHSARAQASFHPSVKTEPLTPPKAAAVGKYSEPVALLTTLGKFCVLLFRFFKIKK